MKTKTWPLWWDWELGFTTHVLKRMIDRHFNEIDLREMLDKARSYRQDLIDGRWVVETRWQKKTWEVIVEPDGEAQLLLVITAYPVERVTQ